MDGDGRLSGEIRSAVLTLVLLSGENVADSVFLCVFFRFSA